MYDDETAVALEAAKSEALTDTRTATRGYVMRTVLGSVEELARELAAQKRLIEAQAEKLERLLQQLGGPG